MNRRAPAPVHSETKRKRKNSVVPTSRSPASSGGTPYLREILPILPQASPTKMAFRISVVGSRSRTPNSLGKANRFRLLRRRLRTLLHLAEKSDMWLTDLKVQERRCGQAKDEVMGGLSATLTLSGLWKGCPSLVRNFGLPLQVHC